MQRTLKRCRDMVLGEVPVTTSTDHELDEILAEAWETLSSFGVSVTQQGDLFHYFESLENVMIALSDQGILETVENAMRHISYLARASRCHASAILAGGTFAARPQVIRDTLVNITAELNATLARPTVPPPAGIPAEVFTLIVAAEQRLVGWCSREKALTMVRMILEERPRTAVELGVFGGRSLVPCAAALRHNGAGVIYGIGPWSQAVAVENPTNDLNDAWWSSVDFSLIKQEFFRFIAGTRLTDQVAVIEAKSERAATLFDQIDFLHIDGSHSPINAAEDVIRYVPKVRSGGIVVFDDLDWQSTAPARVVLDALCDTLSVLKDPESGVDICAVLRRH